MLDRLEEEHVQRPGERPAIHHHALAVGNEFGIDDAGAYARLPG